MKLLLHTIAIHNPMQVFEFTSPITEIIESANNRQTICLPGAMIVCVLFAFAGTGVALLDRLLALGLGAFFDGLAMPTFLRLWTKLHSLVAFSTAGARGLLLVTIALAGAGASCGEACSSDGSGCAAS